MTRAQTILLAGAGSAGMLLIAFGFQYIGGLLPCAMCLWQRWPHAIAVVLAAFGSAVSTVWVALLGAGSMLVNAGIALFHTGVERDWWEGPQTCAGSAAQDLGTMSGDALLDFSTGPRIVMCDEVAWSFAGLSMASWNGIVCLALAAIWIAAARRAA